MPRLNVPLEWEKHGYTEAEWRALPKGKRWRLRYPERDRSIQNAWINKNKEYVSTRHRKYQLRRNYGITEKCYASMLAEQDGRCAICGTDSPTGKWKVFAVDHDHFTGAVRGLLCNECNRGMGLLRDDPNLLRKAADYLDNHVKTQKERKGEG